MPATKHLTPASPFKITLFTGFKEVITEQSCAFTVALSLLHVDITDVLITITAEMNYQHDIMQYYT